MTNNPIPPEQQDNGYSEFTIGQIATNIKWLISSIERHDTNITRLGDWKSDIDEKVTTVSRCVKDLKVDEKDLQDWKKDIDKRLKDQENWKAQHLQLETWKSETVDRIREIETWKNNQSGAWNLAKYIGASSLVAALVTFILTKYIFI